jgi:hypothetical protein
MLKKSGRTCTSKRRWFYLLYQFIARWRIQTRWFIACTNVEHYEGKTHQRLKTQRSLKSLQYRFKLILEDNILAGHDIGSGGLITTYWKCVLPITFRTKINFSVFEEKISSNTCLQRTSESFSAKDDAALESKLKQTMSLYKMGTVTTRNYFDWPLLTFIAKYRDIWFKTSFFY